MSTHKTPNKVAWRVSKVEGIGRGWSFIAHIRREEGKPEPLAPSEQVIETRVRQRKRGRMEIRRKMREQSGVGFVVGAMGCRCSDKDWEEKRSVGVRVESI
jgi:hypothetical protein